MKKVRWEKIWGYIPITAVVGCFLHILMGRRKGTGGGGSGSGGSVWTVGSGQAKKFGSHSSFRHRQR